MIYIHAIVSIFYQQATYIITSAHLLCLLRNAFISSLSFKMYHACIILTCQPRLLHQREPYQGHPFTTNIKYSNLQSEYTNKLSMLFTSIKKLSWSWYSSIYLLRSEKRIYMIKYLLICQLSTLLLSTELLCAEKWICIVKYLLITYRDITCVKKWTYRAMTYYLHQNETTYLHSSMKTRQYLTSYLYKVIERKNK